MKTFYEFSISSKDSIAQLAHFLSTKYQKLVDSISANNYCTFKINQDAPIWQVMGLIRLTTSLFPQLKIDFVLAKIRSFQFSKACIGGAFGKIQRDHFIEQHNLDLSTPYESIFFKRFMKYGETIYDRSHLPF